MSEPLRLGVVGVGYLGSIHAKIYAGMENIDLIGVVDANSDTAARVAQKSNCAAFGNSNELFDKVDAVSIAVPTSLHRAVSEPFLRRGIHVMLEKPIAPDVVQAEAIVQDAEDGNAILQIGHLERFNAGVMTLAEHIDDPRFIEVHRLGTFVERATDVDVVTDLMIHDIDIVLTLIDSELKSISAMGVPVVTKHVDIANARLEFANGAIANVTASRVSTRKFRRIRVFAKSQYVALNFQDQQIEIVRPGESKTEGGFPEVVTQQVSVEPRQPLDAELAHFVDTVRQRKTPLVGGREGLEALRVAERVKRKINESMAG